MRGTTDDWTGRRSFRSHARSRLANSSVVGHMAARFIAGPDARDAVAAARRLAESGLAASVNRLDALPADAESIAAQIADSVEIARLADGLDLDVSIKRSSLGGEDNPDLFADALAICDAVVARGFTVTVDMEDGATIDATLELVAALRERHRCVGVAVQADLPRTEADCESLAASGTRVRLCKGAYLPAGRFPTNHEVDLSYVRCLRALMEGGAYPMVATHDSRLIAIAKSMSATTGVPDFEFQMLMGVRHDEQVRIAADGYRMRTYIPYGSEWMPWVIRRFREKPASLALVARSLAQPAAGAAPH